MSTLESIFDYPMLCEISFNWDNTRLVQKILEISKQSFKLNSELKILIPACGTGRFAEYFSQYGKIDAFDLSAPTIQFANKYRHNSKINFYVDNLSKLSNTQLTHYDLILILNNSFQYLTSPLEVNNCIKEIIKRMHSDTMLLIELGLNADQSHELYSYQWKHSKNEESVETHWQTIENKGNLSFEKVRMKYNNSKTNKNFEVESNLTQLIWNYASFNDLLIKNNLLATDYFLFPNLQNATEAEKIAINRFLVKVKKNEI